MLDVLSLHAQQTDDARSEMTPLADAATRDDADSSDISTIDGTVEATEAALLHDAEEAEVSQPVAAAAEGGDAPLTEKTFVPANGHTTIETDADALSPIVPQSFGLAVIVPAQAADTTDITNEPVDEQTSGAPHRLDADDAREEERAA